VSSLSTPSQGGKAKVTLTYVNNSTGSDKDLVASYIAEFNKTNPNITVNYNPIASSSWGDYFDKIATLIAGGTPPDVMKVAIEGSRLVAGRDLILPLDPFINNEPDKMAEYFADVDPRLLEPLVVNGKRYQLSFDWNNMVMYYNKKMFQEAGVPVPMETWTKDQFVDAAQKLTKRSGTGNPDVYGFGFAVEYFASTIPWLFSNDTNLLTEDWTRSQANDPKVVEAVNLMRDLVWDLKVAPKPPASGNDIISLFAARKVAMFGRGRSPLLALKSAGMPVSEFDIAPWPIWKENTTEFGTGGPAILKSSKYPQESWQWVKFLTTPVAYTLLTQAGAAIPARRSIANSDAMFKDAPANSKYFYASIQRNAKSVPAPKQYNQVEQALLRNLGSILANETTAEKGMNAVHKELMTILA